MKYIKIIFFLCAFFSLFSQKANAQNSKINVSAVVLDVKGDHIPGAVITNNKDKASTVSNESGEFSITVSPKSVLYVGAVGYETNVVTANAELKVVKLKLIENNLVQVAFNKANKADLQGGVSNLNVVNLLNNNYYNGSLDNLSSFIPGYSNNIWGQSDKLVLVDGVPRDQYNVIPSEIDQITVMKSAAAIVLYGSRAARGVINITTKRGIKDENKFKVRLNTGIYVPKRNPQYLGSADYMKLYNEALTNDNNGVAPATGLYPQSQIDGTTAGTNPIKYPDVNFYSSDYIKKYSNRTDVTTEYTGGNNRARFYLNMGYYNTNTLINFGHGKDEGENRFNVRGNLDLKLSDMITAKVNSSITFYDQNTINTGSTASNGYWQMAATLRPNQFAPFIPLSYLQGADAATQGYVNNSSFLINGNSLLGGISTQLTNPFADAYVRGYNTNTTRKYQFDASLNFDLAKVLKGLSFETQFAVDYNSSYQTVHGDNSYAVYAPLLKTGASSWSNDSIKSLTKYGTDQLTNTQGLNNTYDQQTLFFSGAFKYANTFNKVHNVSAMLLGHTYKLQESQVYHASAVNLNFGLQASYNYMQKYYLDFAGSVVHSAKLAPGHRDAFSPTVSLGWRISNEDFLSKSDVVNDLKITASAGILNTDLDFVSFNNGSPVAGSGYYMYQGIYSNGAGSYWSWQEGRQLRSTDVTRGANPSLTFEKKKEISLGLETSLFNRTIQISGNYFYNLMSGIPVQIANLFPNYLQVAYPSASSFIPYVNYNEDQRTGFDIGANFNKRIQKLDLSVGVVATYYHTKANVRSENNQYAYQNLQGKPLDAILGLKSLGFFKDAADIAASPKQTYGTVMPGDIKYEDVNHDGVIDDKDRVYLGTWGSYGSPLTLALNVTAKWNNFTLFILANSGTGSYGMKNGSYYWATGGTTAKYSEPMLGRWTAATAETATYPRLTTTSGDNNFRNSDFWLYKNDRINLAKVQLSYDIPKKLLSKTFISDLGVYINGNDLLLIAKERVLMETNIGSAPQTRYFSAGVKVAF
ncbi:TonB-dependent receptor [Paludibacter propionicigenes WB4]|uniref:TonB-dependent receptor n=1 Tax=Paludibacter propionicigenes (strain DSM 17365 / JCM 13257 / WB4) TaxID=694427 RepID=E4T1K4_PALPW|nr:SusC/RagA family TonB-linked outer membrane protein [Paludibacter propionicigenes]ADQ78598.1 TonB-dependent receptor [Paludibacter propionicigenes WB4]